MSILVVWSLKYEPLMWVSPCSGPRDAAVQTMHVVSAYETDVHTYMSGVNLKSSKWALSFLLAILENTDPQYSRLSFLDFTFRELAVLICPGADSF